VTADLSLISLFLEAGILVQLVMLLLLAASIFSWTIIFNKVRALKQAQAEITGFEAEFWSGQDMNLLYQQSEAMEHVGGMRAIFVAGFKEFAVLRKLSPDAVEADALQRMMRVAMEKEVARLEQSTAYLASVGSTSPYVGLFGTVWGIMNAFSALGDMKQATLALVAPHIAEALFATAMGLFAAIPAVVAYNVFANRLTEVTQQYELFIDELTGLLLRYSVEMKETQ
jgi:biopolymer transport protein TolQ